MTSTDPEDFTAALEAERREARWQTLGAEDDRPTRAEAEKDEARVDIMAPGVLEAGLLKLCSTDEGRTWLRATFNQRDVLLFDGGRK